MARTCGVRGLSTIFVVILFYDVVKQIVASDSSLSFQDSTWIWSPETDLTSIPEGPRAFRKTFTSPQGKELNTADILITADDSYNLYVDGNLIGASPFVADQTWWDSQWFLVELTGNHTVFAVVGVNGVSTVDPSGGKPNAAGLLATIAVTYEDGSNDTIYSDVAWKANKEVDAGFQSPAFDDASWPPAASIGSYGVAPWLLNVSVPEFPVVISTLTSVTQPTSAAATTAMAGLTPTSSNLSASTITASNSSSPTPPISSAGDASKSHRPVIIGGAVGGIAFCLIIIFLVLAFLKWRRNAPSFHDTVHRDTDITPFTVYPSLAVNQVAFSNPQPPAVVASALDASHSSPLETIGDLRERIQAIEGMIGSGAGLTAREVQVQRSYSDYDPSATIESETQLPRYEASQPNSAERRK